MFDLYRKLAVLLILAVFSTATAQVDPQYDGLSPRQPVIGAQPPTASLAEFSESRRPEPQGAGWRLGMFDLHPYATADVRYDDNIYFLSRNEIDDLIWRFSPGLHAATARERDAFLRVDYSPSFVLHTYESRNSRVDHFAELFGEIRFNRLTLSVEQDFEKASEAVIDAAARVDRTIYRTTLGAHYQYSDKTSFEANGSMLISDFAGLIGSTEWANRNWVNYQLTHKLRLSLGATFGYLDVERSPSQVYQQALVRGAYAPTDKLSFSATAGAEFRQFEGTDADDISPVFALGAQYAPRPRTSLSLTGLRQQQNSAALGLQNYTITGVTATIRQRILHRLYFSVSPGYELLEYYSVLTTGSTGREDNSWFVRSRLGWVVSDNLSTGIFYLYRRNDSTLPLADFENNQVGLEVSARF